MTATSGEPFARTFENIWLFAGAVKDAAGGTVSIVAVALLIFHFFAPFCFLLFRPVKRSPQFLVGIAALIFVAHIVDLWWMVAPSVYQNRFHISWMAPAAFIAIGGIWLTIFFRSLEARPLIPLNDPRFAVALPTRT